MKLSEVKPCIGCDGPLRSPMAAGWYVIRVTQAMLKPQAVNQTLGLTQIFGGRLGLAEVFSPDPDAVMIMGDHEPGLMDELHICYDCFGHPDKPLYFLMERMNKRREKESAEKEKAEADKL